MPLTAGTRPGERECVDVDVEIQPPPNRRVVTLKDDATAHRPQLLPGGDALLFTLKAGADWDKAQIVVRSYA